ncbi:MAG: arginine repressor [Phycisphaerales bacterium]|nr:arginine repressor [Phycisphaerales bacterium]
MAGPKVRRRRLIARFIQGGGVTSQEQLRELLIADGVEATQATLSRDLRDLGVVKGPDGYVLPEDLAPERKDSAKEFADALQAHLLDAEPATHFVVLHTAPGHAQALAVAIDGAAPNGVAATIAGDDAIFVALRGERASKAFLHAVRTAAGLE